MSFHIWLGMVGLTKGLQGMTTHLGHCQSTKTTESHSQPYSTEPAVLSTTQSLGASL